MSFGSAVHKSIIHRNHPSKFGIQSHGPHNTKRYFDLCRCWVVPRGSLCKDVFPLFWLFSWILDPTRQGVGLWVSKPHGRQSLICWQTIKVILEGIRMINWMTDRGSSDINDVSVVLFVLFYFILLSWGCYTVILKCTAAKPLFHVLPESQR